MKWMKPMANEKEWELSQFEYFVGVCLQGILASNFRSNTQNKMDIEESIDYAIKMAKCVVKKVNNEVSQ